MTPLLEVWYFCIIEGGETSGFSVAFDLAYIEEFDLNKLDWQKGTDPSAERNRGLSM
jgi:hypothetical protein